MSGICCVGEEQSGRRYGSKRDAIGDSVCGRENNEESSFHTCRQAHAYDTIVYTFHASVYVHSVS